MLTLISTAVDSFAIEDNQLAVGAVGAAAILAITAIYQTLGSKDKRSEFPKLRGIQLYHAWNFFRRRYDFLRSNLDRNPGRGFSFNVFHHNIVVLTGEDARRVFYSNQHLGFAEGYRILAGASPRVRDVDIATQEVDEDPGRTVKRLNRLLNKTRTQDTLPALLQDIIDKADKWDGGGKTGRIEPFTDISNLVFVTTARMVTCRDLAENEADLKKIGELFMTLQTSDTPVSLLLPWIPSPSRKAVKKATTELYSMLDTYVETRRHAKLTDDAMDVLIADGETNQDIVGFVMVALFAGIINTSNISCWTLIDLAIHPEWREKCKNEVQDLLSRYVDDTLSSATLAEKLKAVPLSAWESELPIVDACIRESHRIAFCVINLRRNIREEMKIGEQVVRRGDFLVYSLSDVHLNDEYYPEPHKYDPSRWLRPDSLPSAVYPFLGWGIGKHPCPGMKMGKLEMKLIVAMVLTRYKFDLVDKDGKFPDPLPAPDRNNIHQVPPLGPTYFNFEKVME